MLCDKHTSQGWTTDFRTGAVDRVPLTEPLHWKDRLYVANCVGRPYPLDKMFWVVVDIYDAPEAVEVAYDRDATFWLPAKSGPYFSRQDGEPGTYSADEIMGWTFDQDDAEEAVALAARLP